MGEVKHEEMVALNERIFIYAQKVMPVNKGIGK